MNLDEAKFLCRVADELENEPATIPYDQQFYYKCAVTRVSPEEWEIYRSQIYSLSNNNPFAYIFSYDNKINLIAEKLNLPRYIAECDDSSKEAVVKRIEILLDKFGYERIDE